MDNRYRFAAKVLCVQNYHVTAISFPVVNIGQHPTVILGRIRSPWHKNRLYK